MNKKELQMYFICAFIIVISLLTIYSLKNSNVGITGAVIIEDTTLLTEFEYVSPGEVNSNTALDALIQAEVELEEIESKGLQTFLFKDTLLKAKRTYFGEDPEILVELLGEEESLSRKEYIEGLILVQEETPLYEIEKKDLKEVFRLTQLITFRKNQAYSISDTIKLLEKKEKEYNDQGIETPAGSQLLEEARIEFKEERYDEAEAILNQANIALDQASKENLRVKELVNLSKNFFEKHWWKLLIIIIVLIIIIPPLTKVIRKKRAKSKLEALNLELKTLDNIIKKTQEDYFKDKKITKQTFDIRTERYRKRKTEIKHTIPVLEALATGKKPEKKKKNLKGILKIKNDSN